MWPHSFPTYQTHWCPVTDSSKSKSFSMIYHINSCSGFCFLSYYISPCASHSSSTSLNRLKHTMPLHKLFLLPVMLISVSHLMSLLGSTSSWQPFLMHSDTPPTHPSNHYPPCCCSATFLTSFYHHIYYRWLEWFVSMSPSLKTGTIFFNSQISST